MSYDGVMMMLPLPPLFGMHIKIEVKIRDLIVNLKIFFFFFCLFACQDWWICPSPPPKKKPSKTMQRACFYQHITAWSLFSGKKSLNINNC